MLLSWIDLKHEDLKKAREFLDQFKDHSTIDHLGLGIIRDRLAEIFFPATSTVMTRAKYFYLVPAAISELEKVVVRKQYRNSQELMIDLKFIEMQQARELMKSLKDPAGSGIIGHETLVKSRYKRFVERTPSEIYWASLQRLGFFNTPWADLNRTKLVAQILQNRSRRPSGDTRGDLETDLPVFEAELYQLNQSIKDLNMDLSAAQRNDLANRYQNLEPQIGDATLFSYALNHLIKEPNEKDLSLQDLLQLVPKESKDLRPLLAEAINLSYISRGANLAYNYLLSQNQSFKHLSEDPRFIKDKEFAENDFREWFSHESKFRRNGSLEKIVKHIVTAQDETRIAKTFKFLDEFHNATISNKGFGKFVEFIKAKLISQERLVKGSSARLEINENSAIWPGLQGTGLFDYRWSISRRIITDIAGDTKNESK